MPSTQPPPGPFGQPGSFGEFRADVRRALSICRQVPWLPALELSLVLLMGGAGWASTVRQDDLLPQLVVTAASIVYLSLIGWIGAQRLVFRGVMQGHPVGFGQLGRAIHQQGWRTVKLAFLMLPVGAVLLAITVVTVDDLTSDQPQMSLTGRLLTVAVTTAMGIVLTLVTPCLAFETDSARAAWERGTRRLREHWRLAKWHALVPPVLFSGASMVVLGVDGPWTSLVANLLGAMTFIARGATVALHLRIREQELAALPPPRPVIL